MERCLQAEQCRDGSLVVLSCRDAALDQQPVIFSENTVLLLNFAHYILVIKEKMLGAAIYLCASHFLELVFIIVAHEAHKRFGN